MATWQPPQAPHGAQRRSGGGRNGQRTMLAVVGALVVIAAAVGGVVAFAPELVGLGDDDSADTTSTLPEGKEGDVLAALGQVTAGLEAGDLSTVPFAVGDAAVPVGDTTTTATVAEGGATTAAGPDPAQAATAAAHADFLNLIDGLGSYTLATEAGAVTFVDDTTATVPVEAVWTVADGVEWRSSGLATVRREDAVWLVEWSPAILESSLRTGDRLRVSEVRPTRAPIVARDGEVLVSSSDQVTVGIRPSRVDDLPSLVATLQELVGADPADVTARVEAATAEDRFVEVVTLPRADYNAIRDEIQPLPGTEFQETTTPSNADPNLARALLGRSGEVTAEIIEENPGLYEPGDIVGISGLQEQYNAQLSGTPGIQVEVLRAVPTPTSTTTGTGLITTSEVRRQNEADVLFSTDVVDGEAVILTIDPTYQRAAEQALSATDKTSAMVVIQISTGQVLAVANGPTGNTVNFAMTGQYPPGSIFKVVTGYEVVRNWLDLDSPIACPPDLTIQGTTIGNAEGEASGTLSWLTAFANSCNTAFMNASRDFAPDVLNLTAAEFGLGRDYQLGADVFAGNVPVTEGPVDLATTSFGQGRTLLSPFSAAVMAATAGGGTYRSPILITSGEPPAQTVEPLDQPAGQELQTMMRAVVTQGTGGAVAGVPGPPVSGKTGTAEFGSDKSLTHAWFVGYQGDLAFAVLVEEGGFGGSAAAPLAANFLAAVAGIEPGGSTTGQPAGGSSTGDDQGDQEEDSEDDGGNDPGQDEEGRDDEG